MRPELLGAARFFVLGGARVRTIRASRMFGTRGPRAGARWPIRTGRPIRPSGPLRLIRAVPSAGPFRAALRLRTSRTRGLLRLLAIEQTGKRGDLGAGELAMFPGRQRFEFQIADANALHFFHEVAALEKPAPKRIAARF